MTGGVACAASSEASPTTRTGRESTSALGTRIFLNSALAPNYNTETARRVRLTLREGDSQSHNAFCFSQLLLIVT